MSGSDSHQNELDNLRTRVAELEDTLSALKEGKADALVSSSGVVGLAGTEKPYQLFFQTMFEGGVTLDQSARILHCNPRFSSLLEMPVESLRGRDLKDWILPRDHEKLSKVISSQAASLFDTELRVNGIFSIPVQLSLTPMNLDDQQLICMVVSDMTLRVKAEHERLGNARSMAALQTQILDRQEREQALKEAERFTRATIDALSAHICVLDETGKILFVNKAWTSFYQENSPAKTAQVCAPYVGESYLQVCDHSSCDGDCDAIKIRKGIISIIKGEIEDFVLEYPCDSPTEKRWFQARVTRFANNSGNVVVAHENITERKLAEELSKTAREKAEALAKTKSNFLANMSHEIRTPMNGVIGLTQLALNHQTSPDIRDYLEKILLSSESLLGILNDILDLSKLEAGRMSVENELFDLDRLLDTLRNLFEERAHSKGLKLEIEVDASTPRELMGDSLRIQQILSNLLGNAIKFTNSGCVILKVDLVAFEPNQAKVRFSVEDSGLGIAEDDLGKLFQQFSQVDDSNTRRFGGTGLGLAITQNLLSVMKSECKVASKIGKGSTFYFELLLGLRESSKSRTLRERISHDAGSLKNKLLKSGASLVGARILVAEDNRINQQVVSEFLKLSGMEVTIAKNGKEALDLLDQQSFDAILMDVHMPVMDGEEATRCIRQNPNFAKLPIIALTADVMEEEKQRTLESGMNDFISKPVSPQALLSALTRWVSV